MKKDTRAHFGELKAGDYFCYGRKKAKWLKDVEGTAVLVVRGNRKDVVGNVKYPDRWDVVYRVDVLVF